MGILIDRGQLCDQLGQFFSAVSGRTVQFHVDLRKIGLLVMTADNNEMCQSYLDVIHEVGADQPILFPTFDYDFPRTGIYDRENSASQVGALNDFARQAKSYHRTDMPIFHFAVRGSGYRINHLQDPSQVSRVNCFGSQSTFAEMMEQNAVITFFGAGVENTTFVHHLEEVLDIGYRYPKIFTGKVIKDGVSFPVELSYRVRPNVPGSVDYDWSRLDRELLAAGLLNTFPAGNGKLSYVGCRELFDFWREKMLADEYALLTDDSRRAIETLTRRHGRQLTVENVEG